MPYLENFHTPPTNTKSSLAGVHNVEQIRAICSKRDGLGFTVRFLDGFHIMSPSYKSEGFF